MHQLLDLDQMLHLSIRYCVQLEGDQIVDLDKILHPIGSELLQQLLDLDQMLHLSIRYCIRLEVNNEIKLLDLDQLLDQLLQQLLDLNQILQPIGNYWTSISWK